MSTKDTNMEAAEASEIHKIAAQASHTHQTVSPLALETLGSNNHVSIEIQKSVASAVDQKGLVITYRDLNYHVPSNVGKGRAYLLKSVTGHFKPGEMSALMGPSGSGKTTLLDVLAGRKTVGTLEGTILFSGFKSTQAFLRRYAGYVEQFDTLIGTLTVQEMLMYTAELKRDQQEPLESKKQAVAELLDRLALVHCKDVKIGDAGNKGISGGQAKRTNIGIALITNPRVLFLDEPTSGLDSYTSNEVMTVVKALVKDGTTICATIHSPSSYCYNLFDSLTMLVKGQTVYFGPIGRAPIDFILTCLKDDSPEPEVGYNDAEYLVNLITDADRKGRGAEVAEYYGASALKRQNDAVTNGLASIKEDMSTALEAELNTKKATNTHWWFAILILFKYRTSKNWINPEWLGPRIGDKILISFIIFTLFWKVGKHADEVGSVINISAVLFMWTVLPAFGAASYIPSLVLERNLFARERNDGLYYTATYLTHKIMEELIVAGIASVGIAAYTFWLVRFAGQFILFWLVYWVTLCNGIVLAYFVAAISPNIEAANALLPTYVVTLLFFAGFIMNFSTMPNYWKWYSYIDFIRYSWGALMVNQYEHNPLIYTDGKTVLQVYSLNHIDKWQYLGYEALFFIFFYGAALTTMMLRKYQSR